MECFTAAGGRDIARDIARPRVQTRWTGQSLQMVYETGSGNRSMSAIDSGTTAGL
jgi:hypothetical protein